MNIEVEHINNIKFIIPEMKALDLFSKKKLSELCQLESSDEKVLALDLSMITHVDSSILGFLLELSRDFTKKQNKVVLFSLNPEIQGVLEMTKLIFLIQVEKDRESVLAKYS